MSATEKKLGKNTISPIIHCYNVDEYIDECVLLSSCFKPKLLAIPERGLGAGILEIAKNIMLIRKVLNKLKAYQCIHILGTGNPLSMMIYYFMGADSFDGLDWCQTVVDFETATLHHTLHLDLYSNHSKWGKCDDLGYYSRCYLHNLEFYSYWMTKLRKTIDKADRIEMIRHHFPDRIADQFVTLINEALHN